MADSDHTTRLSSLSRRKLLTSAASSPLFPVAGSSERAASDPILSLWQEWERVHAQATGLCHHWQKIETLLMRKVGVPQVRIKSPDKPEGICALSHAEIDRALT